MASPIQCRRQLGGQRHGLHGKEQDHHRQCLGYCRYCWIAVASNVDFRPWWRCKDIRMNVRRCRVSLVVVEIGKIMTKLSKTEELRTTPTRIALFRMRVWLANPTTLSMLKYCIAVINCLCIDEEWAFSKMLRHSLWLSIDEICPF